MAVTNRYKGDARCGFTTTGGIGQIHLRLRIDNDASAMADRAGFEGDAGTSKTFYYKRVIGGAGGGVPNKTTIEVRRDSDNTVIRSFLNAGAEPANGTAYTFFFTHDGTSTGVPRAGTVRLYLRTVLDNSVGGGGNYDVDTDGNFGAFGASLIVPVPFADSGCLRSNAFVSSLTVSTYPAGSLFAVNDTIALTAAHTQKYGATGVETVRFDVTNSSDVQQVAGAAAAIDAGTSYVANFVVGNNFPFALLTDAGCRLLPVGSAAFVPTSGAIPWTKFIASGTVVQDGNNVKRSSFFNVDPRITAPILFHTQAQGGVFKDPPSSGDIASGQRAFPDVGYVGARFVNARGEGVNGLTATIKLWDSGLIASSEASPANSFSGVTATRRATAPNTTPQIGWLPLGATGTDRDKLPITWSLVVSGTWRVKTVITAPSNMVGLDNYQLSSAGEFWNRNLFYVAAQSNYAPLCNVGQLDGSKTAVHMQGGEDLFIYAFMQDLNNGGALVQLVEANGDGVKLDINTVFSSTGRFKYLDPADNTWKIKAYGATIPSFVLQRASDFVAGGDPDVWVKTITGIVGATPAKDFLVQGVITKDGVTYPVSVAREVTGPANPHDKNKFDALGLFK